MTTIKGTSMVTLTGALGAALLVGLATAPAGTAHADGMPGLANATVVFSDGYLSMVDVCVAPELAGADVFISADGIAVAGMMLVPGSNPMPLPAANTYVVTALGAGDIAWATVGDWDQPGFE